MKKIVLALPLIALIIFSGCDKQEIGTETSSTKETTEETSSNKKQIEFSIKDTKEYLSNKKFDVKGTSPNVVTVKEGDKIIKEITPNENGAFRYSGSLPEKEDLTLTFLSGEKTETVVIKPIGKLSQNTKTNDEESNDSKKYFGLNEDLPFENINNKVVFKLKITEVTTSQSAFPEHMVSMTERYNVSKMIAISIEYTNVDMNEPYLPHSQYFQAYADGKALTRVDQQDGQDYADKGRTGKTKIFFDTEKPASEINEIELDFVPTGSPATTFKLPVSH